MAIEGKPLEDSSGRRRAPIPGLPEIGNETAYPGTISTAAWGVRPAAGLGGLLSAPESGSGYWLGLSDAITVTGLSR